MVEEEFTVSVPSDSSRAAKLQVMGLLCAPHEVTRGEGLEECQALLPVFSILLDIVSTILEFFMELYRYHSQPGPYL